LVSSQAPSGYPVDEYFGATLLSNSNGSNLYTHRGFFYTSCYAAIAINDFVNGWTDIKMGTDCYGRGSGAVDDLGNAYFLGGISDTYDNYPQLKIS